MQINVMRLSLIQFESLAGVLNTNPSPAIPYGFLLDSGKYQAKVADLKNYGPNELAWATGYGKLFWQKYLKKETPTPRDFWDLLVPFKAREEPTLKAPGLKGYARARAYLYPWGIGVLADFGIEDQMAPDDAVDRFVAIRNSDQFEITLNGVQQTGPVLVLLEALRNHVRGLAYGAGIGSGEVSDLFSVVTVMDATGADPKTPVADQSPLHNNLNGFARLVKNWNGLKLDPIAQNTLQTRPTAPGSILFGTRRGRAAWFPDSFISEGEAYEDSLRCYHQNLSAASLQTEALCMLAKHASGLIQAGTASGMWMPNYDQCARRAAGLLGRMVGGVDTYRSHSIPSQIEKTYKDPMKDLRTEYGMS